MGKEHNTLGCCGLDCGLCPRFYTKGNSKCPGCCGVDFENKHPSCSFITCCVKKMNLEVCAECDDFPCSKFNKETGETDSFVTHRRVIPNQNHIKEYGLATFIEQQKKRIGVLEEMLLRYNDGRSKNFYCLAATLLSLESLEESLKKTDEIIKEKSIETTDFKGKAGILKGILNHFARDEDEELKLRKAK